MGRIQDIHPMFLALVLITLLITIAEAFVQPSSFFSSTERHRNRRPRGTSITGGSSYSSAAVALEAARGAAANQESLEITKRTAPPALSVPVFSLATLNEDGSTNMNIVTYASPVGIEPERLWMVSLFKSTLTYENFVREGWGVLQLLRRKHAPLVPILGQSGGRETDKSGRCTSEAFPWVYPSCEVLSVPRSIAIAPGCASYLTLHMASKQPAGDHDAVICRIGSVAGPTEDEQSAKDPESETLESRHLRQAGIIK
ncbi:unnamed protein product [Hapterophycus canaliculatus]